MALRAVKGEWNALTALKLKLRTTVKDIVVGKKEAAIHKRI